MSSISSVASTSSVLRPAALFYADCVPSAVTMDPHQQDTLQFSWTLCAIHLADLHAAPLNPYQQDLQPSPTQSSPTHPTTFPTANRAINTGAGPALTLAQATSQAQPASLSVPAPFSRTAVVQSSTDLHEKIRLTVMDPRDRHTIKGALSKHGVSERVFRRRRWIAELAVLDHPRLLDLVKRELGANGRIRVGALNDAASRAVQLSMHLKDARAAAISCGRKSFQIICYNYTVIYSIALLIYRTIEY